jgi:hypothetical protein
MLRGTVWDAVDVLIGLDCCLFSASHAIERVRAFSSLKHRSISSTHQSVISNGPHAPENSPLLHACLRVSIPVLFTGSFVLV